MEILEERRKRAERNFDRGDEVSAEVYRAEDSIIKTRAARLQFQFKAKPVVKEKYTCLLISEKKNVRK